MTPTAARLGVLWCPNWPVVVAGAAGDEAVVVLHANRVVAVSRQAAAHGVRAGMRRRQAQGACPAARLVTWDPDATGRAFEHVARAVGEMIPRLEITEPGMITFSARGPARYFGGEVAMAERVVELAVAAVGQPIAAVRGFGLGIADGRFAATVAARHSAQRGAPQVVVTGTTATAAFLAELPTELLGVVGGVDPEQVGVFQRLGLDRLGQFAALDPTDVVARFGAIGRFAHRLAGGHDERLPDAHDPPVGLAVEHHFDDPATHSDVVVFTARRLAHGLTGQLAAEGRVCTRLEVAIETDHGERCDRAWYRPAGLTTAAMVERVRWQLDGWAADLALTAGITRVRLDPVEVRSDDGTQQGMWGGQSGADESAARAVARLVALTGDQQVLVPASGGGRLAGDVLGWVPAATADLADPTQRLCPVPGPWPGQWAGPPPAVVHRPPRPMVVYDAADTVVTVGGRGAVEGEPVAVMLDGRRTAVIAWAGPWPVEERWWDARRSRRVARFQLLLADGRLLDTAVEQRQWWLFGEHA